MSATSDIVQKLWSLSSVLRDDGMVYHQYMSELTYLLFLKIAQETKTENALPIGYRWHNLVEKPQSEQLSFYRKMLTHLGEDAADQSVREIFSFPTTVFKHPSNLRLVINRLDGLNWYSDQRDDFGDIYEGLLEKNAVESKSGAGQYFTPRSLIDSIVSLVKPRPNEIIQDPAAGTGGFLVSAAHQVRSISGHGSPKCQGVELVKDTYRLCLMNMFVHEIEGAIIEGDALSKDYSKLDPADVILSNPPFGTKSGGGSPRRDDLPFPTMNKQLLFLQHIMKGLAPDGRAAVIVPDNVLFEGNVAQRIRSALMQLCDLHTVLRLPTGIFYAGVKTNVLFFTRRDDDKTNSSNIWFYDARTGVPPFGKRSPITRDFFRDFEQCFGSDPYGRDPERSMDRKNIRWKRYDRDFIRQNADNLDLKWMHAEPEVENDTADVDELTNEIASSLQLALSEVQAVADLISTAQRSRV